jgi:orotidine-5'-phosphate decarboxylase
MNIIDKLIFNIIKTKNPTVVGLDPDLKKIPHCYMLNEKHTENALAQVSKVIFDFNKDIIDTICAIVPAVKPQIAFYEKYGSHGIMAFEETVKYAKSKGLIVIEDGKRNDIGNTALAYAEGHLGLVDIFNDMKVPSIDVDFLTVSPFLGSDSITPFVDVCISNNKGIFVLVKTSNSSSGEIQDAKNTKGMTISQSLAEYVAREAANFLGEYKYSPIGAVVGATYPEEARILRAAMPRSYFLVPGYGAQGANAYDILPCFNDDGLGAIVNSSRAILYSHMSDDERKKCTKAAYLKNVYSETINMQRDIYEVLIANCSDMAY